MKKIYQALSDFQNEVPVIHKSTQGYGYTYAELSEILTIINPLLKKHGLGFTQVGENDKIKTIIFHVESAETIESVFNIPQDVDLKGMNKFQVLGSAITYIRRYALSSALGIVTDKDTDAASVKAKAKEIVLSDVDIEKRLTQAINKPAIVKLWGELTESQQKQYVTKFTQAKSKFNGV